MTKISVIIPCYNVEKYIAQCLDTTLDQTIKDIEVICVDDKSTDNTLSIINDYSKKDKRVKVIAKDKNEGAGKSRNKGIDTAKGEYVVFMDPDDYYPEEQTLEKLYCAVSKNSVNIAGGNIEGLNPDGTKVANVGMNCYKNNELCYYKDNQFCYGYTRFIYNREFLVKNEIYFPDYLRFQDPPFFVKAMALAQKYYSIADTVYVYRISHKTITWNERRSTDVLKGINNVLDLCRLHDLKVLYLKLMDLICCDIHVSIYKTNAGSKQVDDALKQLLLSIDFNMLPPKYKFPYSEEYNEFIINDKILNDKFNGRLMDAPWKYKLYYKYKAPYGERRIYILGFHIFSYKKHRKG